MSDWTSEYLILINDCEQRESRMTDWERTFIDSMKQQLERGRHPSQKQIESLDRVWERVTKNG